MSDPSAKQLLARNHVADRYLIRRFGDGDETEQADAIRAGLCDHWDEVQAEATALGMVSDEDAVAIEGMEQ